MRSPWASLPGRDYESLLAPIITENFHLDAGSGWWRCVHTNVLQIAGYLLGIQHGTYDLHRIEPPARARHTVRVYRHTEGAIGPTVFKQLTTDGKFENPEPAPQRYLEFLGDSHTAAQGNLGCLPGTNDKAGSEVQDGYLSYGAITARKLSAETTVLGGSGKGLARDYLGRTKNQMNELFYLTIPSDPSSLWPIASHRLDALIINLGTNDYAPHNQNKDNRHVDDYVKNYIEFITQLKKVHPETHVFLAWFKGRAYGDAIKDKIYPNLIEKGIKNIHIVEFDLDKPDFAGCLNHTSVEGHKKIAKQICPLIKQKLNWHDNVDC